MILEEARKEATSDNMAKLTLTAMKMNAVTEEQEEPTGDDKDVPEEVQYAGRYRYPAARKSVFKNIRVYRYRARPVTPKNYNPRPKSSNRYVFVEENDELEMETEENDDNEDVEAGDEERMEVELDEEETVQQTEQEERVAKLVGMLEDEMISY